MKYIFSVIIIILFGCHKEENQLDKEFLFKTIEYKQLNGINTNLLSLDIYYENNTSKLKPIVIYVHGGAWCTGDKSNQIENKVNLFHSLNYVFVSVNYRLSPFPYELNNPNRIKFPDHNIDLADAILWVSKNIKTYGGDKNKIVLLGHSAGAHLVALTGTNKKFMENIGLGLSDIKGVAVIDTEGYNVLEQVNAGEYRDMYINAFGTDIKSNIDASPILNITDTLSYPKFFVAKRGTNERIAISDEFISILEDNNIFVSQIDGSIYDHSEINDAIGKPGENLITPALVDFFKICFN